MTEGISVSSCCKPDRHFCEMSPPQLAFAHSAKASRARRKCPACTCSRACCVLFTQPALAGCGGALTLTFAQSVARLAANKPIRLRLLWYILSNLLNLRCFDPLGFAEDCRALRRTQPKQCEEVCGPSKCSLNGGRRDQSSPAFIHAHSGWISSGTLEFAPASRDRVPIGSSAVLGSCLAGSFGSTSKVQASAPRTTLRPTPVPRQRQRVRRSLR